MTPVIQQQRTRFGELSTGEYLTRLPEKRRATPSPLNELYLWTKLKLQPSISAWPFPAVPAELHVHVIKAQKTVQLVNKDIQQGAS